MTAQKEPWELSREWAGAYSTAMALGYPNDRLELLYKLGNQIWLPAGGWNHAVARELQMMIDDAEEFIAKNNQGLSRPLPNFDHVEGAEAKTAILGAGTWGGLENPENRN